MELKDSDLLAYSLVMGKPPYSATEIEIARFYKTADEMFRWGIWATQHFDLDDTEYKVGYLLVQMLCNNLVGDIPINKNAVECYFKDFRNG